MNDSAKIYPIKKAGFSGYKIAEIKATASSKIRKLNTLKSLSKMIALVLVYSRQKLTKSKVKKFVVKMKKYFFAKKTIEKINDFIRQISAVNT